MIIYLIKLILILVFNVCVNIYYINSGCKCCGDSKSGEIGSGSKGNLGTNPPKGTKTSIVKQSKEVKPKKGAHTGGMKSGSKSNLGPNPPISTNPSVGPNIGGEGDGLKGEKYELIQRLNDLISANDALGDYKINIPINSKNISSLKDKSQLVSLKQSMELYTQTIECKKLQKDCLSMFEAINTENEKLLEKEDISEFKKEDIRNEQNINKLKEIYEELTAKKQKISETFSEQENLLSNVNENNIKLKNLIGNFYENEIQKTPFDAKINNVKSLSELKNIKKELDYILGKVFVSKRIKYENMGVRDYEVIYYDKLKNDLENGNIYRIMQIMNTFISRASREICIYWFLLFNNENDHDDPFNDPGYIEGVFEFFRYLFLKSDSFRNAFKLLLWNISGNSLFANNFKSIFYDELDNGVSRYNLINLESEFSGAVLILESKRAEEIKDFLGENGISLGAEKDESKLRPIKTLSIEKLNEKVFADAHSAIDYKNFEELKANLK